MTSKKQGITEFLRKQMQKARKARDTNMFIKFRDQLRKYEQTGNYDYGNYSVVGHLTLLEQLEQMKENLYILFKITSLISTHISIISKYILPPIYRCSNFLQDDDEVKCYNFRRLQPKKHRYPLRFKRKPYRFGLCKVCFRREHILEFQTYRSHRFNMCKCYQEISEWKSKTYSNILLYYKICSEKCRKRKESYENYCHESDKRWQINEKLREKKIILTKLYLNKIISYV